MRRTTLVKISGGLLIGLGAVHMVVTPIASRRIWAQVAEEGWWDAFTPVTGPTLTDLQRSEAFWDSIGSLGVPTIALGCYLSWSAGHDRLPTPWLGWGLTGYGALASILMPRSPMWALPAAGVLLIIANRDTATPADSGGSGE